MFSRKVTISRECMEWLQKAESFDVKKEKPEVAYSKRCAKIQEDVLKALTTASAEPASLDGKTEVVVDVILAKAEKRNTMMVVTRVYAVVHTKNNKEYYIKLDKDGKPKKFFKIGEDIHFSKDGGKYVELLKIIKSKKYRISM